MTGKAKTGKAKKREPQKKVELARIAWIEPMFKLALIGDPDGPRELRLRMQVDDGTTAWLGESKMLLAFFSETTKRLRRSLRRKGQAV